mmetsp:Transcript_41336/g.75619  ORF Transcript_41336/g.75619 Transcript_41336/m.75619 type:complete len:238 (-) Transcript_41336:757-1470(-)
MHAPPPAQLFIEFHFRKNKSASSCSCSCDKNSFFNSKFLTHSCVGPSHVISSSSSTNNPWITKSILRVKAPIRFHCLYRPWLALKNINPHLCLVSITTNPSSCYFIATIGIILVLLFHYNLLPHPVRISLHTLQHLAPIWSPHIGIDNLDYIPTRQCLSPQLHFLHHTRINTLLCMTQIVNCKMQRQLVIVCRIEKVINVVKHGNVSPRSFAHGVDIDLLGFFEEKNAKELGEGAVP